MYERFFNLTAEPFRLSPDHRFCYKYPHYARVKAYMAYALRRAEGFVMLTGPAGSGKTTLISDVVEYLVHERVVVANLVSTQLAAKDLLRMVAFAFGVDAQALDKATTLQQLTKHFHAMHREGGRALLIVDEAQNLTSKALEELRLLTNLEREGEPLLQIFLLGQPQLRELLRDKQLEPVSQRIIAASQLQPLTEEETKKYVEYRLRVVGWKNDPAISESVYSSIYQFSEGLPRHINLICNRLLLHCFVEQSHQISAADALAVVKKLQEEQLPTRNLPTENVVFAKELFDKRFSGEPLPDEQFSEAQVHEVQVSEEQVHEGQVPEEPVSAERVPEKPLLEEGLVAETRQLEPFFLLGQPELRHLQRDQRTEPVYQRIAAVSPMQSLTVEETRTYVESGLRAAGWNKDPAIGAPVFRIIHKFSEGVPDRINQICNRMLLTCFVEQRHRITVEDARAAVEEIPEKQLSTRKRVTEPVSESPPPGEPLAAEEMPEPLRPVETPVMRDKAQFESRDVPLASHSEDEKRSKNYAGPEQRRQNRRSAEDRRKDIRFEVGKEDRRKNPGKRHDDKILKFW